MRVDTSRVKWFPVEPPPPRRFSIEETEIVGKINGWYGREGTCKTYLAARKGISYVTGIDFLGKKVLTPGPFIFYDCELSEDDFWHMVYAICRGLTKEGHRVSRKQLHDSLAYVSIDALTPEAVDVMARDFKAIGPVAVHLDSLSLSGITNNDNAIALHQKLRPLILEYDLAFGVNDHQGGVQDGQQYSSKTNFGSVLKNAIMRTNWQLDPAAETPGANVVKVLMRDKKHSYSPLNEERGFAVDFSYNRRSNLVVSVAALDVASDDEMLRKLSKADRTLRLLRQHGPILPAALWEKLPEPRPAFKTFTEQLSRLKKRGKAVSMPQANPSLPHYWDVADRGPEETDAQGNVFDFRKLRPARSG